MREHAKHTPGPWRYSKGIIVADIPSKNSPTRAVAYVGDEWRHIDGLQYGEERDANGEFIERACNSHDALLAACKAVLAGYDNPDKDAEFDWPMVAEQLRTAIAEAKRKA